MFNNSMHGNGIVPMTMDFRDGGIGVVCDGKGIEEKIGVLFLTA